MLRPSLTSRDPAVVGGPADQIAAADAAQHPAAALELTEADPAWLWLVPDGETLERGALLPSLRPRRGPVVDRLRGPPRRHAARS